MTDERHDLENLMKHPGWQRLVEHGQQEIQGRLNTAIALAANERDDVMALNQLRQCLAAKHALEAFIAWPTARVRILIEQTARLTTTPSLSRRGVL